MGKDWKQWAADKGLQKWFRKDNFIILILMGVLLVIIALPSKESAEKKEDTGGGMQNQDTALSEQGDTDRSAGGTGEADTQEDYAAYLEKRLTEALSQMENVGKVEVMITLKSSRELVVEKEQPVSRSTTNEKDSQGGSRIVSEMDSGENTVYRTEGNASEPYVIKTLTPQIEGVLVVAQGAGQGTVNRTIVEIAEALFGVEAHKVKVVKMSSGTEDKMQ